VTFELVPERLKRARSFVTISPLANGFMSQFHGDSPNGNGSGRHGGSHGAVCIVRDLSELRAAEAAAREQRGFLVKLIEHAKRRHLLPSHPTGRLIWFNEQLVQPVRAIRAKS
jgi:hypothetical protein